MSKVVQLLCELIALPSVNPALLEARPEFTGERHVAEFLAAKAAGAGLEVKLRDVEPHRPNLFIRLAPAGKVTKRVVLAPHLDTVGGHEVPGKLFTPQLRRGRLHGRGACDTKGSVAAFLSALEGVTKSGRRPANTEIFFIGLMDEEKNQAGSRMLVRSGFKADLAIVGEPTRLRVVTAHKGALWLELETRGKAAHGARPELGRNAVLKMARVVELLETAYARELRQRRHAVLGHPTVNVGSIHGGQQPNIVPDRCVISLDRRTLPGERDAAVKREILSLLRRHGSPARFVGPAPESSWPMETDSRQPLVAAFLRSVGQTTPAGVHYFSDAGVLAHGGIPSVLFGPGDIAQAHTADEWTAVSQLEKGVRMLERFLRTLP